MAKKRPAPSLAPLPEPFKVRMSALFGEEESRRLIEALDGKPSVSVRINRRKAPDAETVMAQFEGARPVEWCKSGFYLDERPDFVHDPLLHAGVYYVQEAASMVYETLTEQAARHYEGKLRVLDLCAAPGGKTTAMLNGLADREYEMVANEYDRKRVRILKENIEKWGDPNVTVTNSPAGRFAAMPESFDIVAVDAPCSGEGMMRREPVARTQWSDHLVSQCAATQKEILSDAVKALKPGGTLIYSTCTFNNTENEDVAAWIETQLGLTPEMPGRHFMPHREECEGLYVATFRKPAAEDGVTVARNQNLGQALRKAGVNIIAEGIETEIRKGAVSIPSSKKVLAYDYDRDAFPLVELSHEEALSYLRRNAVSMPEGTPQGIVCVAYKGYPLGLVKNIGARANNLYPAEWRILT